MVAGTKTDCSWTFLHVQQIQWLAVDKQIDEWIFAFAIVGADSNFGIRQDI